MFDNGFVIDIKNINVFFLVNLEFIKLIKVGEVKNVVCFVKMGLFDNDIVVCLVC